MKKLLFITIFMSVSFAYAGEIQFTMADLEKAVKNEAELFESRLAEYNKNIANYNNLSKKDKAKQTEPQYPVPMAIKEKAEYIIIAIAEGTSRDLGLARTKAEGACKSNIIKQFIRDAKDVRLQGVSFKDISIPYGQASAYQLDDKAYQNNDGSYLAKTNCAVKLKDVLAQSGIVAIAYY